MPDCAKQLLMEISRCLNIQGVMMSISGKRFLSKRILTGFNAPGVSIASSATQKSWLTRNFLICFSRSWRERYDSAPEAISLSSKLCIANLMKDKLVCFEIILLFSVADEHHLFDEIFIFILYKMSIISCIYCPNNYIGDISLFIFLSFHASQIRT